MRRARIALLGAVGITLVVLTAARVHVWGDERLVWTDAALVSPHKPRPWLNLGRIYHLQGNTRLASDAYTYARELAQRPGRSVDEQRITEALAVMNLQLIAMQGRTDRLEARRAVIATQLLANEPAVQASYAWIAHGISR